MSDWSLNQAEILLLTIQLKKMDKIYFDFIVT